MIQSSHGARDHDTGLYVEQDRALTPVRPTLDAEPRYETMPVGFYNRDHNRIDRFTDDDTRQAAWWAVLAGACGHTYGNNNIWQMWQPDRAPILFARTPWFEALDDPGARQMGLMRRFLEAHAFGRLEPDPKLVLDAPREGGAKVRAARTPDGRVAIVYTPRGAGVTVDRGLMAGPRVRESWYDPRYGTLFEFHVTDTVGLQTYTPPTSGPGQDWVLLLEAVPAQ
jgi:hypothetical protein